MRYAIDTLQDFLKVPPDRLGICLRDFERAMMLHWLAHGENAPSVALQGLVWTDDGDLTATLVKPDGEKWLELRAERVPHLEATPGAKPNSDAEQNGR